MEYAADVLVVGAGPTGLLLAGDLAAAGAGCVVVERRQGESNLSRAFAVHARTLEQLDARGLADELAATGHRLRALRAFGDVTVDMSRLPSRFNYVLITPQYETERLLERRARACGAEIWEGTEAVGLRQDASGVEVTLRRRNGTARTVRARYVVGADGARSTVRRALGLAFPGRSVVRSMMLADVRLAEDPPDALTVNATGDAFALLAPFGDGWYRVVAWDRHHQVPDSAPVGLPEIRRTMRLALGSDYGAHDPRWMSRFHSDERQVPRYRVGRVFLAGDAAHIHSPAGGLGMNTGMQDAANLSWKLAAALQGWAPPGLLDSYQAERHPVGRAVLLASGAIVRVVVTGPPPLRAVRNLLGRAVTGVAPLRRRATGLASGLSIAYPAPKGAHRLTGRRAPDIPLADGRRLYQALRDGCFLLVAPRADDPAAAAAGAAWADRVRTLGTGGPTASTVLVRPDGYIAWAADRPSAAAVRDALAAHCGPPRFRAPVPG